MYKALDAPLLAINHDDSIFARSYQMVLLTHKITATSLDFKTLR